MLVGEKEIRLFSCYYQFLLNHSMNYSFLSKIRQKPFKRCVKTRKTIIKKTNAQFSEVVPVLKFIIKSHSARMAIIWALGYFVWLF